MNKKCYHCIHPVWDKVETDHITIEMHPEGVSDLLLNTTVYPIHCKKHESRVPPRLIILHHYKSGEDSDEEDAWEIAQSRMNTKQEEQRFFDFITGVQSRTEELSYICFLAIKDAVVYSEKNGDNIGIVAPVEYEVDLLQAKADILYTLYSIYGKHKVTVPIIFIDKPIGK